MTFFQNTLDYFQGTQAPRQSNPLEDLNNDNFNTLEPQADLPLSERERGRENFSTMGIGEDIPPPRRIIEPLPGDEIIPPPDSSDGVDVVETLERLQLRINQFENILGLGKKGKAFEAFSRIPLPNFTKVTHSLLNPYHSRTIDTVFNHIKFDPTGTNRVSDFLTALSEAQDHCPVSRQDFLRLLLAKCSGRALELVNVWNRSKYSIEQIYKGLFDSFDESLDSSEIRKILGDYKFPRHFKLRVILGELQILISQALRAGSTEVEGMLMTSILLQDTLKQCMPVGAYKLIQSEINKLKRYKLREPNVHEICEALLEHSLDIDYEIKVANGHQFGPFRLPFSISDRRRDRLMTANSPKKKVSFFKRAKVNSIEGSTFKKGNVSLGNNSKATGRPTYKQPFTPRPASINKPSTAQKSTGSNTKGFQNKGPKNPSSRGKSFQTRKPMDKFKGRPQRKLTSCSYCGSLGHDASQTCYSIVDNNFRVFTGPPSQIHCSNCFDKLNKKFFHMIKLCPLRDHMINAYKMGTFAPRGIFKKYYLEHHA